MRISRVSKSIALVLMSAVGGGAACNFSSCFAGGTMVATPAGHRPIESIAQGDLVLVADPTERVVRSRRVLAAFRHSLRETFVIDAGSSHLRVTAEHPLWAENRGTWVLAGEIRAGDVLCVFGDGALSRRVVEAVRRDGVCVDVFELSVEGPEHTFFADGVLVHNKEPSCTPDSPYANNESVCGRPYDASAFDASTGDARTTQDATVVPVDAADDAASDSTADSATDAIADAAEDG